MAYAISSFLKNERTLVLLLGFIALVRIFVFSAAFPFFNNVDEESHFDTVVKYARGYIPCNNSDLIDDESASLIARYGTPESYSTQSGPSLTPLMITIEKVNSDVELWSSIINREAYSPPLYYLIAGSWYNLGKLMHLQGGYLLYWIRFLNLPIYALLLWMSYLFCKFLYPESPFLRQGMILLLAFFPQDVFYSINNDVLSPLFFLSGLFLLLKLYSADRSQWLYFLAGAMVAATILVKLSNLPALLIYFIILVAIIKELIVGNRLARRMPHILLFSFAALAPIFFWTSLNHHNLGDFMGTAQKIQYLGWAPKPFSQLLDHPVFTLKGMLYFLGELTKTFWRGEIIWRLERIASVPADILYVVTSALFGLSGAIYSVVKVNNAAPERRLFNYLNLFIPFIFVLFLAALSIRYDFGDCGYPSKALPFLTSGRLILAMLIPFLILYLRGVEFLCGKINDCIDPIIILLLIVIFSAYMDINAKYACGVFASPYNFFHLP